MAALLILALALAWSAPCSAEDRAPTAADSVLSRSLAGLTAGARVRITAPLLQPSRRIGTLLSFDDQSLIRILESEDAPPTEIPLGRVARVDLSAGSHGHVVLGAGLGLVLGVLVGAGIGAAYAEGDEVYAPLHVGAGATLGGALGLATGAVVGALVRSERWRELPH
jgi:hypothetical protein